MGNLLFLGGLGMGELVVIVLIVLLLFGGKKIPELMKGIGKGVKSFKDGVKGIENDINATDDDNKTKEIKYILGYISKSAGFTSPTLYEFEEDQQFIFESIMYSAMTLYNNGGASRTKLAESHRRWENELSRKKEYREQYNVVTARAVANLKTLSEYF